MPHALTSGSLLLLLAVAGAGVGLTPTRAKLSEVASQPEIPQSPTIAVNWEVPYEVKDPTNLADAAIFAWNEFIALTWPAQAQGPDTFPRGVPYQKGKYGDAGPTGQVVWETFRHKVETFPGQGEPNGYNANAADYGFASKPQYVYKANRNGPIPDANGLVPPVSGLLNPTIPPFNNLDEVTQITLNAMYAGVSGASPFMGGSQESKASEKILFEAKVNEVLYKYAAEPRMLNGKPYAYYQSENPIVGPFGVPHTIKDNSVNYLETGDSKTYPPPYINLPASNPATRQVGAIEIKASFRKLNPAKEDLNKFYTAPVRYYVGTVANGIQSIEGFIDSNDPSVHEVWGLTSLHIIQKTPNVPTFVYATFGHINNILDANGNDVELPDGTTKPQYLTQEPFLPALTITPSTATDPYVQQVTLGAGTSNTNSPQLYYHNVEDKEVIVDPATNMPYKGPVNINRRLYPIPPTITAANRMAHNVIRKANNRAVWLNYRLVNVQARPLDLKSIPKGEEPTFFLANEVVETNTSLQHFSGGLLFDGTISDYYTTKQAHYNKGDYIKNTYVVNNDKNNKTTISSYNMGGCMGCHGSQGQKNGGDFSVLLANGRVLYPEIIQADEKQGQLIRALTRKYLSIDPGLTVIPAKRPK